MSGVPGDGAAYYGKGKGHVAGATIKPMVKLPKDPSGCWEWLGSTDDQGRAYKTVGGKSMPAARWMWTTLFGPIPAGLVIYLGECGNKACVNPHHLRLGYQADANRAGPGTEVAPISLTPMDVRALKQVPKEDRSATRAKIEAARIGVDVTVVRNVWRGSTWGNRKKLNHGPKRKRQEAAG